MIKNLEEVLKPLGLTPDEFKKQYEAPEEHEIPMAEIEIVKKADLAARIANEKKTAGTAAVEIAVKEARTEFGLEFTGKTFKNFGEALQKKTLADAKIEPDKKVAEIQKDNEKLRLNLTEKETQLTQIQAERVTEKNQFAVEGMINANLPKVKTKIPVQDMALLFKTKHKPTLNEEGKLVLHDEKGEPMKNPTTMNLKTIEEVMADFQTIYIEGPAGGGGGGDGTGKGKPNSMEAFNKEMLDKGINIGSQAYNQEMRERIGAKTLKVD